MNHYNCIYMYISPSNKIYIGKAKDFLKRRKTHLDSSYNEKRKDYNVPFHKAIRKYGIENFKIIILAENIDDKKINEYEKFFIKRYKSLKTQNGYNILDGGNGGNPYTGKSENELNESIQKMKNNHNNYKGINHPRLGRLIERFDENYNLIDIKYQFEYKEMGFHQNHISSCCKWYECEENKEIWYKNHKSRPYKKVGINGKKFIFKYHK